jgi:hypothetical protein
VSVAGTAATRAHPLHTTFTDVSLSGSGDMEIRLRAFIDDFSAAVAGQRDAARPPFATPSNAATARYLARRVVVIDASGRTPTLAVTDLRREGDVVWVTMRAPGVRSLTGVRLTNTVLFERYDDQVNVVQTSARGRRRTVLFTKRDGTTPKAVIA